jgi:hypothetical protein
MKIKLIEDPQLCAACDTRMTGPALHDRRCNSCGRPCYLLTEETNSTGERMRLRRSWESVLMESEPMEQGGSRW